MYKVSAYELGFQRYEIFKFARNSAICIKTRDLEKYTGTRLEFWKGPVCETAQIWARLRSTPPGLPWGTDQWPQVPRGTPRCGWEVRWTRGSLTIGTHLSARSENEEKGVAPRAGFEPATLASRGWNLATGPLRRL